MLSNMLNNIIDMAYYFCANHYDIIVAVAIMVSAIIVFIGFLKAVCFDRIRNKEIRRAVLALANIVCCFVAAFGLVLVYLCVRNGRGQETAGAVIRKG